MIEKRFIFDSICHVVMIIMLQVYGKLGNQLKAAT